MAMAPEGRLSLLCLVSSAYYLLVLAVEMERTESVPQHAIPRNVLAAAQRRPQENFEHLCAFTSHTLSRAFERSYVRAFRAPG